MVLLFIDVQGFLVWIGFESKDSHWRPAGGLEILLIRALLPVSNQGKLVSLCLLKSYRQGTFDI